MFGQALLPPTPARAQNSEVQWRHGVSLFGDPQYPRGFKHFDYVNPKAPKGGVTRLMALGSFDNFNQAIAGLKGLFAAAAGTICDTLMVSSFDEASAYYGLIAEAVSYPANFASTSFRLREAARHHDGNPITVEDVIYSFEAYKKYNPFIGAFFRDVLRVEHSGEREVTFTFDAAGNREMPAILGQLRVLPKHWWEGNDASGKKRDLGATTLEPPLGNAAYRIKEFVPGRSVVYERVKDYWAKDLNVNIGRDNFDEFATSIFVTQRSHWKLSRRTMWTGASRTAPRTGPRLTIFQRSRRSGWSSRNSPSATGGSCGHSPSTRGATSSRMPGCDARSITRSISRR